MEYLCEILNNHLISKAKKLLKKDKDFALEQMLYFFGYIYQLDGIINIEDDILVNKINDYRKNILKFPSLGKTAILNIKKDHDKRLNNFYKQFEDNYFALKLAFIRNDREIINLLINRVCDMRMEERLKAQEASHA